MRASWSENFSIRNLISYVDTKRKSTWFRLFENSNFQAAAALFHTHSHRLEFGKLRRVFLSSTNASTLPPRPHHLEQSKINKNYKNNFSLPTIAEESHSRTHWTEKLLNKQSFIDKTRGWGGGGRRRQKTHKRRFFNPFTRELGKFFSFLLHRERILVLLPHTRERVSSEFPRKK